MHIHATKGNTKQIYAYIYINIVTENYSDFAACMPDSM